MFSSNYLKNYFNKNFLSDLLTGLTTAFAAIALGAAFGVESGRGAFAGMIAAAIIPIITSIFGGTRLQASGPTGPMTAVAKTVILAFAYKEFAQAGLEAEKLITLTFLLSGLLMITSGIFRLGKFINLVPQVVLIGFMNGIALIIWLDQLKKIFGFSGFNFSIFSLQIINMKPVTALEGGLSTNLIFALSSLFLLFTIPILFKLLKLSKKITNFLPTTLVVVVFLSLLASLSNFDIQKVSMGQTLGSPLDLIKILVDYFPNPSFLSGLSSSIWIKVIQYALQLALLGYLDSLLRSLVIDNVVKEKTKKNKELIAQGLGNVASSLFGGIPGAQATIRSVLLLKEGAKTRMSGIFVGIFTFSGIFVFKDLIVLVAYSIFVGILIKAGWDIFESKYFVKLYQKKQFSNKKILIQLFLVIYTTLTTVLIDLNVAVISGTIFFYLANKYLQIPDILETEELARED